MATTLKDIAALAGVSIATASRVLSGKSGIKASTRETVVQIAKDLGYVPDLLAKSMKIRRTYTIGLVVADITNAFYSETAKIIEMKARENNYTVIVCNTNNQKTLQNSIIETLKQKQVDGYVFASVELRNKAVQDLLQQGTPCIMYHRRLHNYRGHFVGCDNYKGIDLAFRHLYDLGHRNIGFISGPRTFSTGMERLDAYIKMSKKLDLQIFSHYIKEGGYEREKTERCVRELLAVPQPPTAIIAANDLMALQVLDTLLNAGYRVPEDFSVVGMDDISIASHSCIQLTTVDLRAREGALLVISNLLNLLEGVQDNSKPIEIVLEPELKVRNTTCPPKR